MYSSNSMEKPDSLTFLHGSRYVAVETLVIIYASGVAAFGISVEIYILIPMAIVNCILVARNCGSSAKTIAAAVWVVKITFLFVTVELCYRNFRKLRGYKENFASSARAMFRQALLFSVTMLFLSSPGLRAFNNATNKSLPKPCAYETKHCGIVNLYEPAFSYGDDKCLEDLIAYVSGREQLRTLRNFIMLNSVSYSVFNVNFLDIKHGARYLPLRIILIILFAVVASSVLVSTIDPFIFIDNYQLPYYIIECILFIILFGLPAYNLYILQNQDPLTNPQPEEEIEMMDPSPRISSWL
ncbi:unnamed protein product [Rotaria sp. Silwood1]|nr:unnamed protein product [Rotaria sp. Silwood1]CAF1633404.1 unnamed protein product [Rotaria sp. Silwood1]CAF3861516.1 unnamed protein product [Rotaria sp. Silwood1]CAF3904084.1 unnamed protein product [Rotaria sp. Silwood1]CAF4876897.1 unnamed protein product [Rotaria sp. Silwood1]